MEDVDVVTVNIDCEYTDKHTLDRIREEYIDLSGYTSIAKDINGKSQRVCNTNIAPFYINFWLTQTVYYLFHKRYKLCVLFTYLLQRCFNL
jgi:hypothetical protein